MKNLALIVSGLVIFIAIVIGIGIWNKKPDQQDLASQPKESKAQHNIQPASQSASSTEQLQQYNQQGATTATQANQPSPPTQPFNYQTADFKGYAAPGRSPYQDLDQVVKLLFEFRRDLRGYELPANSNKSLTSALNGNNPIGINYSLGPPLVVNGEMVDRWKNPLFFHFVSQNKIGVRSAGVDGKMWTEDDIAIEPTPQTPVRR